MTPLAIATALGFIVAGATTEEISQHENKNGWLLLACATAWTAAAAGTISLIYLAK